MIDDIKLGVIMPFPETDSFFWVEPKGGFLNEIFMHSFK